MATKGDGKSQDGCGDCGQPYAPYPVYLEQMQETIWLCWGCHLRYEFNKPIWELQRQWKDREDR